MSLVGQGLLIIDPSRPHSVTPQSVRLPWKSDRPVAETFSLKTHNIHTRQKSAPPVGFEPAISASKRPQNYALDRAVTGDRPIWRKFTVKHKWILVSHKDCFRRKSTVSAYVIDTLLILLATSVQTGRKITVPLRTLTWMCVCMLCAVVRGNTAYVQSCHVQSYVAKLQGVDLFHVNGTNRTSINMHFGVFKDHKHAQKKSHFLLWRLTV